ncbi:MAG: hypothetical protein AAFR98_10905 [Pseudomonadota bacterium]
MSETVELPTYVAVDAAITLCVMIDELAAMNHIKYAGLQDTENPIVRRKMAEDSQILMTSAPAINALVDELQKNGIDIMAQLTPRSKKGAEE